MNTDRYREIKTWAVQVDTSRAVVLESPPVTPLKVFCKIPLQLDEPLRLITYSNVNQLWGVPLTSDFALQHQHIIRHHIQWFHSPACVSENPQLVCSERSELGRQDDWHLCWLLLSRISRWRQSVPSCVFGWLFDSELLFLLRLVQALRVSDVTASLHFVIFRFVEWSLS